MSNLNSIIISTVSSVLFLLSESLPFISNMKYSSIIHVLIDIGNKLIPKPIPLPESQPLIIYEHQDPIADQIQITIPLSDQQIQLPKNSNENSKSKQSIDEITNLKHEIEILKKNKNTLQEISTYELYYITNYIKLNYPKKSFTIKTLFESNKQLFLSKGYTINYDSDKEIFTIKW
jgi:hypothetical protein